MAESLSIIRLQHRTHIVVNSSNVITRTCCMVNLSQNKSCLTIVKTHSNAIRSSLEQDRTLNYQRQLVLAKINMFALFLMIKLKSIMICHLLSILARTLRLATLTMVIHSISLTLRIAREKQSVL